jgi:hypothetical protein
LVASIKSSLAVISLTALAGSFLPSISAVGQTMREDAIAFDKPNGKATGHKFVSGSGVKVVRRDGFWIEVNVTGKSGWIKASQVTFSSPGGSVAIDTGRTGSGNIVSTSAARGLSAKDLLNGKPNLEDVGRLESIRVDSRDVQAFALAGNLRPPSSSIKLSTPAQSSGRGPVSGSTGTAQPTSSGTGKKKSDEDW